MQFRESIVLGLSAVLAALVLGSFFYAGRKPEDIIRVTGAATKPFDSDIVKWKLSIVRNVGPSSVQEGYGLIAHDTGVLTAKLSGAGLREEDVSLQPVNVQREYGQSGFTGYRVQRAINVISEQLDAVEKLALNPGESIRDDLIFESSQLEFFYSGIDELKKTLLADATRDARNRAEEIAQSMGRGIGTVKSARAGVFQIREPYSTEVRDYGIYNSASRRKDITVTVHAEFAMD